MTILIFAILLIIGAPIAIAIGLSSFFAMTQEGISIDVFSRTVFSGIDSFTLIAISFFIFFCFLFFFVCIYYIFVDFFTNFRYTTNNWCIYCYCHWFI